ncbi:MAG: diguanylate cyclase, partial [Humidesulfovibrio sp.]|nr:diguanylate cyclase [Humidesulfovibrio sp.]
TRLTLRYTLALGIVAVLTLASYGLMRNVVDTDVLGAKLLNVAGRQRMLSQRVEILALRAQAEAGTERQTRLLELDETLQELIQGHELLVHGPAKALDMTEGSPALSVLRTDEDGAEALHHGYIAQATALRASLARGEDAVWPAMHRLSRTGDALLERLDKRMDGLQRLGEDTLKSLSALVLVLLGAALAAYLLTGLLLFRPMVAEVVRDREHLESLIRNLETQASTDKLTGAYNRRTWDVEIRREFSKARRAGSNLCLVMTDLDHFKRVNDEHGHQRGDRVLQEFAKRLRQAVRASDTLYRLGGEEFAMLLPGTDIEQGRVTAEKLRLRVAESPLDRDVPITASFGVAVTDGNESPDEFYRRADQAMYAAKEAGRNRVEVSAKDV